MGQAFAAWIERYPTDRLPTSGGLAATMAVTVDLDTLVSGLGSAVLDTGDPISPAQARTTACDAGIIPMVLGGPSVVLDAGRRRRFHTEAMRMVKVVEQGHCTATGRLLCPTHHHRAHDPDPDCQTTHHPNGQISFHPRT